MKLIELSQKVFKPHPKNAIVALLGVDFQSISLCLRPKIAGIRPVSVPLIFSPWIPQLNQPYFFVISGNFVKIEDAVRMTHNESVRFLELRDRRMWFGTSSNEVGGLKGFFNFIVYLICLLGIRLSLFQFVETRRCPCEISEGFAQDP